MLDTLDQGKMDAESAAYLNGLFARAVGGDLEAQTELSSIAFGQPGLPRELCNRMDGIMFGAITVTNPSATKATE